MKTNTSAALAVLTMLFLALTGCATWQPPAPLTEVEAAKIIFGLEREHPRERIYRQYVSDSHYLQFDRIGDDNVIYGWRTCTDCDWTRLKLAGVYTGDYLYLIQGHHEDFFVEAPKEIPLSPSPHGHWTWNTVDKYQVEGRNLIMQTEFRACPYDYPRVKEWRSEPWRGDGEIDCSVGGRRISRLWVATIDETLAGERSSIVDTADSGVQERLNALEALLRDGVISQSEYETKRRDIIDDI